MCFPFFSLRGLTLIALLATPVIASAQTTVTFQQGVGGYTGTIDTMLESRRPVANNGTDSVLYVDARGRGGEPSQVLIRFENLFGAGTGQVPTGATITAATLRLNTTTAGDGGTFHRMLVPWNSDSNWDTLVNGVQADNVEALSTYNVQAGVPALTPDVPLGAVTLNVLTDIQAWYAGATNLGWAILPWPDGGDGWFFNSAEALTVANRPQLSITYTTQVQNNIVPEPASALLVLIGLGSIVLRLRRK